MKKSKHKPPSRERYEKNNPVWSVRMPKEWIDDLEAELGFNGQSRRDFLGVALKKQKFNDEEIRVTWHKKGYSQGYEKGFEDGDKAAKNKYRIWFYCNFCEKEINIEPNSDVHKAVIAYLRRERYGHPGCY